MIKPQRRLIIIFCVLGVLICTQALAKWNPSNISSPKLPEAPQQLKLPSAPLNIGLQAPTSSPPIPGVRIITTAPLTLVGAQSAPHIIKTRALRLVGPLVPPSTLHSGLQMQIDPSQSVGVSGTITTNPLTLVGAQSAPHIIKTMALRLVGAQSTPHIIKTGPLLLNGRR